LSFGSGHGRRLWQKVHFIGGLCLAFFVAVYFVCQMIAFAMVSAIQVTRHVAYDYDEYIYLHFANQPVLIILTVGATLRSNIHADDNADDTNNGLRGVQQVDPT
jgi:hypothetical protein